MAPLPQNTLKWSNQECRHHFLELSLRVDGPREAGGRQVGEDPSRAVLPELATKSASLTAHERIALHDLSNRLEHLARRILLQELGKAHGCHGSPGQQRFELRVVDAFGVQLSIQPIGDPGREHRVDILRSRPVGGSLQEMDGPGPVHAFGFLGGVRRGNLGEAREQQDCDGERGSGECAHGRPPMGSFLEQIDVSSRRIERPPR